MRITYLFVCVCMHACVRVCPGAWAFAYSRVHVALLIQHATRMRYTVTSFVASLALPYFSTLPHTRHNFREKKLLNITSVL
jgi:hypothetical protein